MQIPLTGSNQFAIVDDEDYDLVKDISWQYHDWRNGNVAARGTVSKTFDGKKWFRQEYMHRYIMDAPAGMHVDHINHNTLDNRRENLRVCTPQENSWNQRTQDSYGGKKKISKYRGVSQRKSTKNGKTYVYWIGQVRQDGELHNLGNFKTELEAARAYDEFVLEHRGEYALPNF